jgi:hypothetical protein
MKINKEFMKTADNIILLLLAALMFASKSLYSAALCFLYLAITKQYKALSYTITFCICAALIMYVRNYY